ncbi:unnamed protein product [Allacma fusca]|uniref:Uncharacterized protein n=1 Tax=Allacma fusca TaxID=39272 RepID=A0A8J2L881_9HEXA|nr:unnamed protein product [Allacma fusca]
MPYDVIVNPSGRLSSKRLPFQKDNTNVETIFTVSPEISVDVIKSIKNYFKVNYAAVIYSACSGAIARALERAGQNVPKYYMTSVIIPKPKHPGGLCIHAEILVVVFPLRSSSPEKRLKKVQKCLKTLSNSTAGGTYNALAKTLTVFPCKLISSGAKLWDSMAGTLNVAYANVAVTVGPDYYDGIEISELTTANSVVNSLGMMISMGGINNKQRKKNSFKISITPRL